MRQLYFLISLLLSQIIFASSGPVFSAAARQETEHLIRSKERLLNDTLALKKGLYEKSPYDRIISETLLSKAYSRVVDGINPKSELHHRNSIARSEKINDIGLKIWTELNYAEYLYRYREIDRAMPRFLSALASLEKTETHQLIFPGWTFKTIGYYLGTIGDYDQAIVMLKRAQHYSDPQSKEYPEILDNIGQYYYLLKNFELAEKYFLSAGNYARVLDDQLRYAKILGNLALIRGELGRYEEAVSLLRRDIEISERKGAAQNTLFAQIALGRIFLKAGRYAEAEAVLNEAQNIAVTKPYFLSSRRQIAQVRLDLAERLHHLPEAQALRTEIRFLDSSLRLKDGEQPLNKAYLLTQKALYQQKIAKADEELVLKNNLLLILSVVAGTGFILLGAYLINLKQAEFRRKREYCAMILKLQQEKESFECRLNETRQTVRDQIEYLQSKKLHIAQLNAEIEKIRQSSSSHLEDKEGKLQKLLESHLMTEENWQIFRRQFQKEYPEFYETLRLEFPDLTPANLRIILLQKLGFSAVEISGLLGITQDAVKKSRQRLKRRLGEKYETLSDLVNSEI